RRDQGGDGRARARRRPRPGHDVHRHRLQRVKEVESAFRRTGPVRLKPDATYTSPAQAGRHVRSRLGTASEAEADADRAERVGAAHVDAGNGTAEGPENS